jgi:non-canonical purine NTP pyrophosphatase (RdgB/HAM1 family)
MALRFITGNANKFSEAKAILGEVEQLAIDLPEIQDIDGRKIIEAKLLEALHHAQGELIVEDTSLHLDCLGGLPGPFIKWFYKALSLEDIAALCKKLGNDRAEARTIVGYARSHADIRFFEGGVKGRIVSPRGGHAFGFDPIFLPDGQEKTFAELERAEKNAISHRSLAFQKLKGFLQEQGSLRPG